MKKTNWDASDFWKLYTTPARPHESELALLDPHLKSNTNILILGSTPEFRDLCIDKGTQTTVIDYNPETYHALAKLMKQKDKIQQEHFIEGSWQDSDAHNKYDVILGDHILNVTDPNSWDQILSKLHAALKPTGKFFMRVITQSNKPLKPIKEIIETARGTNDINKYLSLTLHDLFDHGAIAENENFSEISLQSVFAKLIAAFAQGEITEEELDYYKKLGYETMKLKGYIPTRAYVESLLNKHFKVNSVLHGEIYYKDRNPIFVLSH